MEFHEVGKASQTQAQGTQRYSACDPQITAALRNGRIDNPVQVPAFHCESVIDPHPLDMDERTLAFTEDEVLESRQRHQFVLAIHRGYFSRRISCTPFGRSSSSTWMEYSSKLRGEEPFAPLFRSTFTLSKS